MRGHTRVSSLMQGYNSVKHDVTYFKKLAHTTVNHIRNSLYRVKTLIRYLLTTMIVLLLMSQVVIGAGLGQATSSTGGRGWQDFIVIGDALAAFYPHMLGQLKEEYRLELLHNTVQGWIDLRKGFLNYPAHWDVYVAPVIRAAHAVGLPIGITYGYHVTDSVNARYNESVGFLHYYRQLIPDEQKWRYPNGTIALDPYSVGSSRSFTGAYVVRILGDPLVIERLKRLDLYSTMQPQNPYWKEFFIDWGKKAIDRGSDSFFLDSPDGIFTFWYGGGWGCTDTWEGKGLAEYLRAKLGDSNLRALGVESPESFCLKDYLVKKYGPPRIFSNYVYFREKFKTPSPIEWVAFSDVESILRDPIFKETLLYWYRSAIDFVRDVAAQYKSYAYQRGRDIILTSNHFFAWAPHITLAPYMDALHLETNQIHPPPYVTRPAVCKLGQASVNGSKPVWIGEWILNFVNPYEPSPPPRDISNLVRLRVAEAYASGCIMLVPFGTGHPSEGLLPTRLVEGSERPNAAAYYNFISENRDLFKGVRTKADVALLVSIPTMVWYLVPALGLFSGMPDGGYQKDVFGWARALESMGIPYDILLLGMDDILPTDSHTRLKSYSLIIAPELSHISDIHLQAILDFLKAGGRLIVGPSFGIYDEMHNPRPSTKLSAIFSHPNVLRTEQWLGRDYQLTLDNLTPSQRLLSLMKGAVETSLTSKLVITNASQNVYISVLSQRRPYERLIVHLVNYDYRYDSEKDWTIPASNIGITLKIPPTFNPANVTLISPDIPSPIPLTFQLGDGSISFTVPSLKVWDIIVIEDRTAVLQRALEDLQNKYKGLLQAYESLNASHAELSQSYAQLVQTQQKLLAELRAKNEAYAKLSEENQAIKAELESLRSRLDENRVLKAELEGLRGKLAELTQLYEDAVRERKQASGLLLTYQYTAYTMAAITVSSIAALAYSRIRHRRSHH
jgi:regulator of replication initiation timing